VKNEAELIINLHCTIGEGPVWDARSRSLLWVDLLGNKIYALDIANGRTSSLDVGQNAGCVAPREKGGLIAALQHGFFLVDLWKGSVVPMFDPEADKPENRFNDGKCDCQGRLWAGTMSKKMDSGAGDSGPAGSLYCLSPDWTVRKKIQQVTISNGLGWSPDNRVFYYIDSPTNTVAAYDFASETGEISNRRTVVDFPPGFVGMPDGMCVDAEGMLWIALWGGAAVGRWDPTTGELLRRFVVPAPNVSSCAFGSSGLNELYITTASLGTDLQSYPLAGGLFNLDPGVAGLPTFAFGG
jgi:sugar lactone lactonase YvrE